MGTLGVDLVSPGLGVALGQDLLPPPAPLEPLVLDKISVAATNAYSCFRKLRNGYAGAAMRVRRSSDSTEQDIGFVGTSVDTAALLAFAGSGSAYIAKLYDQSVNARDVAQASLPSQPRIVNSGVLEKHPSSGKLAMLFTAANAQLNRNAPATGLGGNPNFTLGYAVQFSQMTPVFIFGRTGSTINSYVRVGGTSPMKDHGGGSRVFTPTVDGIATSCAYVMQHTAGQNNQSGTLRQNGVDLEGTPAGTAAFLALVDQYMQIGYISNVPVVFKGTLNALLIFNAVLVGADLAALEAELASHA